jgi:hypothetical protein
VDSRSEPRSPTGQQYVRHRRGSRIWLGDVARCLRENLSVTKPHVRLITVTAPGADVLPWDEGRCTIKEPHVHSGPDGCRVEADAAKDWNLTAPQRWTQLHKHAQQRIVREFGRRSRVMTRIFQRQKRGVDHVHVVMDDETVVESIIVSRYVEHLRELAPRFGFGYVDDRGTRMARGRAAAYLSGYFAGDETSQLAQAVANPADAPARPVWIAPTLTQFTHCTMRRLRRVRQLYMFRRDQPNVFQAAANGRLPVWFRQQAEHAAVAALLVRTWPTAAAVP